MSNALTSHIDVAQVLLYVFWIFFAGLLWWLRKEDRREGYPLEADDRRKTPATSDFLIPFPKTFLLPHGGVYMAPSFARSEREIQAERTAASAGSPLEPIGDPMLAGVGPASFAERSTEPELAIDGEPTVAPMRRAKDFSISAGPDPRGFDVIAADGVSAGEVKDLWVDRADMAVRYLEVTIADGTARLVPMPMLVADGEQRRIVVSAIHARHFASIPALTDADRVSLQEEEKIAAFFAGGRLYADPKRLGPVL